MRLPDVQLLAFLRATGKQNDEPAAIPPEIDAVAGAKVNPVFENAAANPFDVGQVTVSNPLKRGCDLGGGLNVEYAQPSGKRASSVGGYLFPNVEHI